MFGVLARGLHHFEARGLHQQVEILGGVTFIRETAFKKKKFAKKLLNQFRENFNFDERATDPVSPMVSAAPASSLNPLNSLQRQTGARV